MELIMSVRKEWSRDEEISNPKRSGFAWGKKETDNLIKWYSRAGAKRIADKTDRTELEVTQKAKQLGLN